ncbi:MAG: DNA double-strand break repair nuclease NurA [Chloroflexia bacterium]|nr:DNA double-strand break repair nuclease NurA [Chloroflexia bacterium]
MPFDLPGLMPEIETMATYYAQEYTPELRSSSQQAWDLFQRARREELCDAARRETLQVLAYPEEELPRDASVPPFPPAYRLLASDGSAIAPDSHFPVPYALLHVALVGMAYHPPAFWVEHDAHFLFRREDLTILPPHSQESIAVEGPVVDTLRSFKELEIVWQGLQRLPDDPQKRPLLAMTDAIILWTHRGSGAGHNEFKEDYLRRSVELLESFRQAGRPLVSFLSLPHHREVVNTLMARACPEDRQMNCAECRQVPARCQVLRPLQDRHLFGFLPEGARSPMFRPIYRGDLRWRLPPPIRELDPRLAFFYLNTGPEVARVELPLWILEQGLVDLVQGIILDQCRPLRAEVAGYPVALSMAHHEAILTTRDRRALQWMIEESLARRQIFWRPSVKAQMKGS